MPIQVDADRLELAQRVDSLLAQALDLGEIAELVESGLSANALRHRLHKMGFDVLKGRVRFGLTGEPLAQVIERGEIVVRETAGVAA